MIFLIILEYFLLLHKMMQCMSKDFLFTTIPDVTDILKVILEILRILKGGKKLQRGNKAQNLTSKP